MAKTGKNITDRLGNSEGAARIAGQKGRPQARPTTPARKAAASKAPAATSTLRSTGVKGITSAPATRPRSRAQTGEAPFQSTRDAMATRRTPVQGPATRPQTRPQVRLVRVVPYSRWRDMSRAERRAANLPLSDMPETAYTQAMARR